MILDMAFKYDLSSHNWWTITGHKDTHSSTIQATDGIEMEAINIEQSVPKNDCW